MKLHQEENMSNRTVQNLIGIYEKALPQSVDWRERLSLARQIGFDYVELSIDENEDRITRLDWNPEKKKELALLTQEIDIPFRSMSLSAHRKYPLGSADESIRQQAREIFSKALDLACSLGIRMIQIMGYWVFYEEITPRSKDLFMEGLQWCVARAERYGVMLGMENVEGKEHISSISQAMEYVRAISSPWFHLYSDFANLAALGHDVASELETGQGHYIGMHVKDALPGQVRRIPIGEGCVDFPAAFNKLAEMDYRGPFLIEMWNDDSPRSESIIRSAFQQTVAFLQNSKYMK